MLTKMRALLLAMGMCMVALNAFGSTPVNADGVAAVVSGARLNVTADTPIGAPVSARIQAPAYGWSANQTSAPDNFWIEYTVATSPIYGDDVYATNITGIGVRYYLVLTAPATLGCTEQGQRTIKNRVYRWNCAPPGNGGPFTFSVGRSVEFVNVSAGAKTGSLTSIQAVTTRVQAPVWDSNIYPKPNLYDAPATGSITTRTCTLDSPSTVNLPTVSASSMPAVGRVGGDSRFSITGSCTGPLLFRLSFNSGTSFQNSAISVMNNLSTATDAAKGFGVQITDSTGAAINASTVSFATTVDASAFSWPLIARYYRFNADAQPGSVRAMLIYTLDYF